jgi:uncharacterized YccA/Bax inhibitor family protein
MMSALLSSHCVGVDKLPRSKNINWKVTRWAAPKTCRISSYLSVSRKVDIKGVLTMDDQIKKELKTGAQIATGTLTGIALFKSMSQSKTLTAMVCIGIIAFSGFLFFLIKMAS